MDVHSLVPISVLTDSYKVSHHLQYPAASKLVAVSPLQQASSQQTRPALDRLRTQPARACSTASSERPMRRTRRTRACCTMACGEPGPCAARLPAWSPLVLKGTDAGTSWTTTCCASGTRRTSPRPTSSSGHVSRLVSLEHMAAALTRSAAQRPPGPQQHPVPVPTGALPQVHP